jgi:hypothetical protein
MVSILYLLGLNSRGVQAHGFFVEIIWQSAKSPLTKEQINVLQADLSSFL